MNVGGAYGGGKAGASFDLITFVQRPQVILRGCCWVSFFFSRFLIYRFVFINAESNISIIYTCD